MGRIYWFWVLRSLAEAKNSGKEYCGHHMSIFLKYECVHLLWTRGRKKKMQFYISFSCFLFSQDMRLSIICLFSCPDKQWLQWVYHVISFKSIEGQVIWCWCISLEMHSSHHMCQKTGESLETSIIYYLTEWEKFLQEGRAQAREMFLPMEALQQSDSLFCRYSQVN